MFECNPQACDIIPSGAYNFGPYVNLPVAHQVIKDFNLEVSTPQEARLMLASLNKFGLCGNFDIIRALVDLSVAYTLEPGHVHRNDPKRADRAFGRRVRKKRTGNRRG